MEQKVAVTEWTARKKAAKAAKVPFEDPRPEVDTEKEKDKPVRQVLFADDGEKFEDELAAV